MNLQISFGYSWMQGDNESLLHGISHKTGRLDFWKNKSNHKKKYETQEKVGHGRWNMKLMNQS